MSQVQNKNQAGRSKSPAGSDVSQATSASTPKTSSGKASWSISTWQRGSVRNFEVFLMGLGIFEKIPRPMILWKYAYFTSFRILSQVAVSHHYCFSSSIGELWNFHFMPIIRCHPFQTPVSVQCILAPRSFHPPTFWALGNSEWTETPWVTWQFDATSPQES